MNLFSFRQYVEWGFATFQIFLFTLLLRHSVCLVSAQEQHVSAKISSYDQEPLPNVNIQIEGTTRGTVSDIEGNYTIPLGDSRSVLVFSSIGYLIQKVLVGNQSIINIEMLADITLLDQVVVVGYTSQPQRIFTGLRHCHPSPQMSSLRLLEPAFFRKSNKDLPKISVIFLFIIEASQ